MSVKRMRVFAGPNGSGKTTIFKAMLSNESIQLGVYVNADDIEQILVNTNSLSFSDYELNVNEEQLNDFFKLSTFSPIKRNEPDLWKKISVIENLLLLETVVDSYLAADIAEFIRQQLLANNISFTYETVMSHESKIDFMLHAIEEGYRVYLYYIATEDPEINLNRVNVRVAQLGHNVDPEVIRSRYFKSLQNLKSAVRNTSRAYIFDNSEKQARLVAEIVDGNDVTLNDAISVPNWVAEYLLK